MHKIVSTLLFALLITVSVCFSQSASDTRTDPGALLFRRYDILPCVADRIASSGAEDVWKDVFSKLGVPWPKGTSISYIPSLSKLAVLNTADNLTTLEQILEEINVLPSQVEIEVRFLGISGTGVDPLRFESVLTDNKELASGEPPQRDTLARVGSVLTQPELSLVLHALQQGGNADLLSAPKITTQSGTRGTIKVVTEYRYATEFSIKSLVETNNTNTSVSNVSVVVAPSGFATRDVGVSCSVLPNVDREKKMIDLDIKTEIVSEPFWKDYQAVYTTADGMERRLDMPQPFFHTRGITTTLSIYNGATVVMGGMISESRVDVKDKVAILGHIPLLGRLFQEEREEIERHNLLIFITARIVNPSGKPLAK